MSTSHLQKCREEPETSGSLVLPQPGDIREARGRNKGKNEIVTVRQMDSAPRCLGKEMPAYPVTTMGQKIQSKPRVGHQESYIQADIESPPTTTHTHTQIHTTTHTHTHTP